MWARGRAELTLSGLDGGMSTQDGEKMDGVIMNGKRVISRIREWDQATKIKVSCKIPSLKPND